MRMSPYSPCKWIKEQWTGDNGLRAGKVDGMCSLKISLRDRQIVTIKSKLVTTNLVISSIHTLTLACSSGISLRLESISLIKYSSNTFKKGHYRLEFSPNDLHYFKSEPESLQISSIKTLLPRSNPPPLAICIRSLESQYVIKNPEYQSVSLLRSVMLRPNWICHECGPQV